MIGEVLVERYTDNSACLMILQDIAPQLIDTVPIEASFRQPDGRATIAMRPLHAEGSGLGILVMYYGYGCNEGDNGWSLVIFPCTTEQFLPRTWDIRRLAAQHSGADDPGPYPGKW